MKRLIGRYLNDNNYYVGSIDVENQLIWVSVEGSKKLQEFRLQTDEEKGLYFEDEGYKVYMNSIIAESEV